MIQKKNFLNMRFLIEETEIANAGLNKENTVMANA